MTLPRKRTRHMTMDLVVLEAGLPLLVTAWREAFPGLIFFRSRFIETLIDREATEASEAYEAWEERGRRRQHSPFSETHPPVATVPRDKWKIPYVSTFMDRRLPERAFEIEALNAPAGWAPKWGTQPISGRPIITNAGFPRFHFQPGAIFSHELGLYCDSEDDARAQVGELDLSTTWLWGGYEPDDKMAKSFSRKVLSIARRSTTNRYVAIDQDAMSVCSTVEKGGSIWIGPHAAAWAKQRPKNFLRENCKPIDWRPQE